jgi:hypothetical protein
VWQGFGVHWTDLLSSSSAGTPTANGCQLDGRGPSGTLIFVLANSSKVFGSGGCNEALYTSGFGQCDTTLAKANLIYTVLETSHSRGL